MPFVISSYGMKCKHEALTKQLNELEAAETAFSRKKVIVADGPLAPIAGEPVDVTDA